MSHSRAFELVVTAEEERLTAMIADTLQQRALNVGADLFATEHALIELGVDPLGIGHFAIVAPATGHKDPRGAYIVIPTDDAIDGIAHHIDVDGSGLFVLGEIQIVDMAGKDGAILEAHYIIYPVALLGLVEQGPNAAILWIFLHIIVVHPAQGTH